MGLLAGPVVQADQNPPGCTGSGLGIFLFTDSPDVHIGDTLTYSVTVFNGFNSGPIVCNATAIQAFVVTPDGTSHPITLVRTALTSGQSDYYSNVVSYVVRAQDIQSDGTVRATASDTGVIHQNDVNSQGGGNQGVNTQVSLPCIQIAVQCAGSVGETGAITFTGSVTNCGNNTLVGVTVTNFVNGGQFPVTFITNLLAGQVATFSGSWIPLNPCSPSTATLVASGVDQYTTHPRTVTSATNTACGNVLTPGIAVTKTCPVVPVAPGQLLTFSGTVTNTGNVTLNNIVVLNSQPVANTPVFAALSLAPGTGTNFTASYLAPTNCAVSDTLTATAASVCGTGVTNTATATCAISTTPQLAITQNCPVAPVAPGGIFTYTGTVTNTGNIGLTNVIVLNNLSGATAILKVTSLAPGAGTNFTGSYLAPTNCASTSTATVTGQSVCGGSVTNAMTTTCAIATTPAIAVTQVCPVAPVAPGGVVTYSGTVTNTGNIPLTNIVVLNNLSGGTAIYTTIILVPGAGASFTGSYLAPTNCSTASTVTASGQSLCGVAVTNTASSTCALVTTPLIAITQSCPVVPVAPGGLLTYSGTVTNTGNIPLTNIVVLNNLSGGTPIFTALILAPGTGTNFTGSYLAPTNCSSTSISTVTGRSICGIAVTNTASTTCAITTTPLIAITQSCPVAPVAPGGLLTYSGTVTNLGDVPLTNIVVLNNVSGATPIFTAVTLAPGAGTNFTGSYLAPTNCSSTSISTVTGRSICGIAVTNAVSTTCAITTTPILTITQNCPVAPVAPGGLLTYSGTVTNRGNIPITNIVVLNNISGGTPIFMAILLAPGAGTNFTGSYLTPTNCSSTSISTVTGESICGVLVTNTASTTCAITTTPLLSITESCPISPVAPGGLLTYSGTVTNLGNIPVTNIVVLNNLSGGAPVFTAVLLAPGTGTNFTGSYLAPTNCSSTSISTVTGRSICGVAMTNVASATCSLSTTPVLAITQNCPTNPVVPGGLLTYSGTVTNMGNITVTNIVVLNNLSGGTPIFTTATLAPGAGTNFTGSYLAPTNCSSTSVATVTGQSVCGVGVTNATSMTCAITTTPRITVTQTCPTGPVAPGGIFTYSVTVTNTGNIPLTNVVVWNSLTGNTPIYTAAALAPGAGASFTGSYPAPTNCATVSTATATGESICGVLVTNTASTTCSLVTTPLIAITQSCPVAPVAPGGLLTYSGTVTNTGNITLTNVIILNNLSGGTPIFTATVLAAGTGTNFTGSYLAPTNCASTSISTVTGRSICGVAVTNTASTTCAITTTPAITVTQVCPFNSVLPGGIMTYSGTVSNAGNITLTNVIVTDNRPAANTVIFTVATLAPGATATFNGSYITPSDCCVVWSTVAASGQGCAGVMVSATATAACTVLTVPQIVVTKICPVGPLLPGDLLTYSGSVSNAGNITLINVTVTDSQTPGTPLLPVTTVLAPGQSLTYVGSYTIPPDFCGNDTVSVTSLDVCNYLPVTNSVSTTCPVTTSPRIVVTKNCPALPTPRGGLFTYTGSVSNAGNVTLVNVYVTDNAPSNNAPVIGPISLAPGVMVSFTNSYIAPTCCCFILDTLTAIGQNHCTLSNVTSTATTICPLLSQPGIVVVPNCPANLLVMGSLYQFSGYVTNTGDVVLTNVFVFGPLGTNYPVAGPLQLAPGEAANYSGSALVPFNACFFPVSASGRDICGANLTTNLAGCPISTTPLLILTQNCPTNPVVPGALLTYSGSVSNAGNITLTGVTVMNNLSGSTPVFTAPSLTPGASVNFSGSYVAPTNCTSTSISTVTGQSLCGGTVTNTASTTCTVLTTPQIAVLVVCPATPLIPGGSYAYSGSVSNVGSATLTNIVVKSDQPVANTTVFTVAVLAPGMVTNFTGTYTVPLNSCSMTANFTVMGQSTCTAVTVTNRITTACVTTTTPGLSIMETCPVGPVTAGSPVVFTGVVTNTGNITLLNVLVFSSQPSNNIPVLNLVSLAPGQSAPFTGGYIANSGLNPTTNSTVVTNSSGTITTNVVRTILPVSTVTYATNTVGPTFGTIDPVVLAMTDRFNVTSNLHTLMYADQNENWGPTQFYTITQPPTGPDTFDTLPPLGTVATSRFNLTASNYDAITLAAPDVGYGEINFYYVRHDGGGVSSFGEIIAQGASSSADLWVLPKTGYNGLAFAAANLGYGANMFYYLRQDVTGLSTFGTLNPTPGGVETDLYSTGTNFDSLVYIPGTVATWGTSIFAYLRHTSIGSVIGTIDPVTHAVTDRMSMGTNRLGSLTYTTTDVGYGANLFYYLRPQKITVTTNIVTSFTTNVVTSYVTNESTSFVTNSVVTFTPTNTVTAMGVDICQSRMVSAAANCTGPVLLGFATMVVQDATLLNGFFRMSIPTVTGESYTVQYKNKLTDPVWTDLQTVAGTGGTLIITNPTTGQPSRFFRFKATP